MPKLTFQPFNFSTVQPSSPFTPHFLVRPLTRHSGTLSHTAYSLTRLSLRRFKLASQRERGFILRNKPFNHSPVPLFNPLHASRFTPHFPVRHLTLPSSNGRWYLLLLRTLRILFFYGFAFLVVRFKHLAVF